MDLIGPIVSLVSGAVGGNLTGAAAKNLTLGTLGNSIAGAIGGAAGTYIMHAVDLMQKFGIADMTVASLAGNAGSGLVGGGVLTLIAGLVKKYMVK